MSSELVWVGLGLLLPRFWFLCLHLVSITQLTSFVLRHIRQESASNYPICATRTVLFLFFIAILFLLLGRPAKINHN